MNKLMKPASAIVCAVMLMTSGGAVFAANNKNDKSEKLQGAILQKHKEYNLTVKKAKDKMKEKKEKYKKNKDAKIVNDFGDMGYMVTITSDETASKEDLLAEMLDVKIQDSGTKTFSDYDRVDWNDSFMYCDMNVSFYYENNSGPDICEAVASNFGAWVGNDPFYAETLTPNDKGVHWYSTQSTGVSVGGDTSGPSGSASISISSTCATVTANWSTLKKAWNYDAQFNNDCEASNLYNYQHYSGASFLFPYGISRNTSTHGNSYY